MYQDRTHHGDSEQYRDDQDLNPRDSCVSLAKFAGPYPVNPLGDHDLRMLPVANIAAEHTCAALLAYRVAGTPNRTYRGWPRSRAQLVALACLPRLASG